MTIDAPVTPDELRDSAGECECQQCDLLRKAADEIELLRTVAPCEHKRYTESPNRRVRQCRDCFRTATLMEYGWDYGIHR